MRGVSWDRYSVMSGSSGIEILLHHPIAPGGPHLRLGAPIDQIGPSPWVQTCPADQHTIELGPGEKQSDILRIDAATVEYGNPAAHAVTTQLHPDQLVNLGRVIRCGVLPGADGPDR